MFWHAHEFLATYCRVGNVGTIAQIVGEVGVLARRWLENSNASKPIFSPTSQKNSSRIRCDFRLASRQTIDTDSRELPVIFDTYNRFTDLCNAYNLKFFGDDIGVKRLCKTIHQSSDFPRPNSKTLEPYAQMQWQDEYAFLNHQPTRAEFL